MPYCDKCGAELHEGSNFCSNCGNPIINKNQAREEYAGSVKKCPNCGEVIQSMQGVCSACGFEIREMSTANTVLDFSQKFSQQQSDEQKISLLRSFPVPNTKEGIFEFMILASSNMKSLISDELYDAWLVKIDQCYDKAQIILTNHTDLEHIEDLYKKSRTPVIEVTRSNPLLIIARNLSVIIALLLFVVSIIIEKTGGDDSFFQILAMVLIIVASVITKRKSESYVDIIVGIIAGGLCFVLAIPMSNGSAAQLAGFIAILLNIIAYFKRTAKTDKKERARRR